ncbi:protein GAMETE EXPRESSED 3 isoform X2 [Silene latifolia]|uniref:protein GAMETE EXPRESSED 3 isoform X2 n=1 Tax=Silene latifolia TaxID=37657 RepID=UPI003D76C45C
MEALLLFIVVKARCTLLQKIKCLGLALGAQKWVDPSKDKGLFAYSFGGRLRWTTVPMIDQSGFSQGCKANVSDCFFTSAPVIDPCDTSIYISNNQGELYSISARRPHLKWVQSLRSFGKEFKATPGNNDVLYVTIPSKAVVLALDVLTGDVLWDRRVGPLSSPQLVPVVDSNGWISVGSLDGFLYSISPEGTLNKFTKASPLDSVIQVSPILDCSGYAVYICQTQMEGKTSRQMDDYIFVSAFKPKNVVFSLLVPATQSYYWSESYPGQFGLNLSRSDLHRFILDEGMILAFIAAAKIGNPLPCRTTRLKLSFSCSEVKSKSVSVYTGNERAILLFLLFETVILVVFAIVVRFCWIFWGKRKLQNQDLGRFLEKRHSLRLIKKEYDKTISELEQKATMEASTSNVLENLSNLVREREGVERKLSTTYSLGRDRNKNNSSVLQQKGLLPIYDGSSRSYSFRGSKSESVTIFHTFNDTYSGDESSPATNSSECDSSREIEMVSKMKGKAKCKDLVEVTESSDEDGNWGDFYCGNSESSSSEPLSFVNRLHGGNEEGIVSSNDKRNGVQNAGSDGRRWLNRRRSLSLSY